MREAYKRGLYENDEHNFWREVESLQMQLNRLDQLTPNEVRQAVYVLENLPPAWQVATMDENRELCQIIFKQVMYDFEIGKVVQVIPKAEYDVLFGMMGGAADDVNSLPKSRA